MNNIIDTSIIEDKPKCCAAVADYTAYADDIAEIRESGKRRLYPLLQIQLEFEKEISLREDELKRLRAGYRHLTETIIPEYAGLDGVECLTAAELQAAGISAKRWKVKHETKVEIQPNKYAACARFLIDIMGCVSGEWKEVYTIHKSTLKSQIGKFLANPEKYMEKEFLISGAMPTAEIKFPTNEYKQIVIEERIEFVREAFNVYEFDKSEITPLAAAATAALKQSE